MLAPWCENEKWEYWTDAGKFFARVTGRQRAPKSVIWNPAWMMRNDFEQQLSEAPWYHPEWPQSRRELYWNYFRNPMQNANLFTWGVADRNYTIEVLETTPNTAALDYSPAMVIQRNDLIDPNTHVPEEGYQRVKLFDFDGDPKLVKMWMSLCRNPRPGVRGVVSNYGWQASGNFEIKYNAPKWEDWPFRDKVATS